MVYFSTYFMFLLVRELGRSRGKALIALIVYGFTEFSLNPFETSSGPGIEYLHSYGLFPRCLMMRTPGCIAKAPLDCSWKSLRQIQTGTTRFPTRRLAIRRSR